MSLPTFLPRELSEGGTAVPTSQRALTQKRQGGGGRHGCFLLAENLLFQVWKENHSAPILPNRQKQSEQLGPSPPTTLSNNDESLMFLPRFTKEQWLTQNYTVAANSPMLIVMLVSLAFLSFGNSFRATDCFKELSKRLFFFFSSNTLPCSRRHSNKFTKMYKI